MLGFLIGVNIIGVTMGILMLPFNIPMGIITILGNGALLLRNSMRLQKLLEGKGDL